MASDTGLAEQSFPESKKMVTWALVPKILSITRTEAQTQTGLKQSGAVTQCQSALLRVQSPGKKREGTDMILHDSQNRGQTPGTATGAQGWRLCAQYHWDCAFTPFSVQLCSFLCYPFGIGSVAAGGIPLETFAERKLSLF